MISEVSKEVEQKLGDAGTRPRKGTSTTTSATSSSDDSSESSGNNTKLHADEGGESSDSGHGEDDDGDNPTNARNSFLEDPESVNGRCNPDPVSNEPRQASQSGSRLIVPKVVRVSPLPPSHRTSAAVQRSNTVIRPKPVKTLTNAAALNRLKDTMAQQVDTTGRYTSDDRRRKDEEKAEAKRRRDAQVDFQSTPASHRLAAMNSRLTMGDPNGQQLKPHLNIHNGPSGHVPSGHVPSGHVPPGYAATNGSRTHDPQPSRQRQHSLRPNSAASPAASHTSSKGKKPHSLGGSLSNGTGTNSDHSTPSIHPAPLFQRLVSEEVQELKAYARIIEGQNRRLAELERYHSDLEGRLEVESNRRMELERTLDDRERTWADQISELENERDNWRDVVQQERTKNSRLLEQVVRKDQDIHRMLQRKVSVFSYEFAFVAIGRQ